MRPVPLDHIKVYEALALGFYNRKQQQANADKIINSRLRENDAYYIIDTAADLESKCARVLEKHPDFIEVFLYHSEGYDERLKQTGRAGGIDPKLLPTIVAKAHAAGLRVAVSPTSTRSLARSWCPATDMLK